MKMFLHVQYTDGSGVDVTVSAPDFVRFEEKFERSITQLESNFRFTDLCFLAWSSLHRHGKTGLDFESWVDTIEEVEGSEKPAEIVPLESPQPTG